MPLPTIPGVVRATLAGVITGGSRWSNTWHFRRIDLGGADLALITELHVALSALYAAYVIPNCPSTTTLEAADYTPLDGSSGAFHLPIGISGGSGGTAMPAEVAQVLTIRTALRGRRHRGRVFLPAWKTASFDAAGHIDPVYATGCITGATAMQVALLVTGWEPGVASYGKSVKTNFISPRPHIRDISTWPAEFQPATSYSMDLVPDVMRSRKQ